MLKHWQRTNECGLRNSVLFGLAIEAQVIKSGREHLKPVPPIDASSQCRQ
jgi:hypothetical protein